MLIGRNTSAGIAGLQTFPDGPFKTSSIAENLELVENLGFDSVWVHDQAIGTIQTLDPFVLLAVAAQHTSKLALGISVIVTPYRSPIHLAKTAASLDHISGGRLTLGLGLGAEQERYGAFGITPQARSARFEEQIDLVKRLWTEPEVTFKSQFWELDRITVMPKPFQQPRIPIWIGAHAEPALKRAVKYGDGWMGAGGATIKGFKQQIKIVRQFLEESGTDLSTFPISKRIFISIENDRDVGLRKLQDWFGRYYHDSELALKVAVCGSEEQVIDEVGQLLDENINMILFNPVYDVNEQVEKLARDIIPKL